MVRSSGEGKPGKPIIPGKTLVPAPRKAHREENQKCTRIPAPLRLLTRCKT